MQVGFIGLGNMGSGMAKNLLRAGHSLTVYNRTRAASERLAADGARISDTPADACKGAACVFTMLANDAAVEAVTFGDTGIIAGLAQGALHISSSTISVELSKRLAEAHAERSQH